MYLHSDRKVSGGLGRKVNVYRTLGKRLVALRWSAYFNDVKLAALRVAHGKRKHC